jgi:PAS domain S-box-containing protein
MSNKQLNNTERTNSSISLSWIVGLAMLLIVFLVWTAEIITQDLEFSLNSIIKIHHSPAIWLADLLPIIALLFFRIHDRRISEQRIKQESFYRKQEQLYNNYAQQAGLLGAGDYDTPIKVEDDKDELGKSLQYLQGFLRATQRKEKNQSWISEGKDMISRLLRLYNKTEDLTYNVLQNLCEYTGLEQGAVYLYQEERKILTCVAVYAYNRKKFINQEFKLGHGLVGQCAYEMDFVYRTEIPEDYTTISSGILGEQKPRSIVLVPLISDEKIQGVMEFASIQPKIPKLSIQFLLELGEVIARTIYNLRINQKTEDLLEESTKMTRELQANEQALRENAELMEKTQLELENSNKQLEAKVKEAENATGKLHWLLENASELISIYDSDLNISYISPSVKKILGYTEEEVKQGKDLERLTREGSQALKELIIDSISNPDQIRTIQYSFITKEGETIFLESSARNMMEDPAINGIIVNSRDITESIRAQKEERLKTRMQSLSENSLDMILRLSINGQFYYVNPVVEDYIGINSSEIINKNLSELDISSDLKEYFERSIASLKSNPEKTNEEISLPLKLGEKITERIISFDAIPEYNVNELETILFAGHDITEAKRIEKELQEKNRNIQDSINYSRKIQTSLLPDAASLRKEFPKSFLFYKPRDVISGDFPWYYKNGRYTYAAAVDCTGHGVPGSMLSFIAYFLLKDVIEKSSENNAGQICDILHEEFRKTLKQEGNKGDTRDGMDIALLKINQEEDMLEFAGAHRPLYHLREGELTEYKGNRKAIGGIELFKKADEKFENHTIRIKQGDKVFFFSDGLTDQLGGPYGRKYSPARVRDLILENPGYTMGQYHEMFEEDFEKWMEEFKQLDDVLMMGIEF